MIMEGAKEAIKWAYPTRRTAVNAYRNTIESDTKQGDSVKKI